MPILDGVLLAFVAFLFCGLAWSLVIWYRMRKK